MFDEGLENGKWVVTYKTPGGELSRTIPMQKKPAFDRYEMHSDAVAIEKVDGTNQRRIVKPDFAEWLKSQQPEKIELTDDYETPPEHNEKIKVAGSHKILNGLSLYGIISIGIFSFLCVLFPGSIKIILIVATVCMVIVTVLWLTYIFTHSKHQ